MQWKHPARNITMRTARNYYRSVASMPNDTMRHIRNKLGQSMFPEADREADPEKIYPKRIMKYPLSGMTSLATNIRVALETKDFETANELYGHFKAIVEHHLPRNETAETILPKCSKAVKESLDKGNVQITEINLHFYQNGLSH